jgi:8-oxo-dGTP diphosphatase
MNKKEKWVKSYFLIGQKAIVFDNNSNILLLRRSQKTPRPGGWDFIGGGLNKNESAIDGIKREIKEEAGINVVNIKPITITNHKEEKDSVVLIFYSAKAKSKKVKLSWEHDDYKWVSKKDILKLKIPTAMRKIIKTYYEK